MKRLREQSVDEVRRGVDFIASKNFIATTKFFSNAREVRARTLGRIKEIRNTCVLYMRMNILEGKRKTFKRNFQKYFRRMKLWRAPSVWIQLAVIIELDQYLLLSFFFFISYTLLTDFLAKDEKVLKREKLGSPLKETIQRRMPASLLTKLFALFFSRN